MKTFEVVRIEDGQESVIGEGVEFTPLPESGLVICVVVWRVAHPNIDEFASREALIGKVVEPGAVELRYPIEGDSTADKPARKRASK